MLLFINKDYLHLVIDSITYKKKKIISLTFFEYRIMNEWKIVVVVLFNRIGTYMHSITFFITFYYAEYNKFSDDYLAALLIKLNVNFFCWVLFSIFNFFFLHFNNDIKKIILIKKMRIFSNTKKSRLIVGLFKNETI